MEGFFLELSHQVQSPIHYELRVRTGTDKIDTMPLTTIIGSTVNIEHTGQKKCLVCGRKVKKLYQNGYCFPCVTSLAECDLCIVKPHECHHANGTCRDNQFAESHCLIPHYVYLAFSSGFKVGLTRKGRQLIRWVDQGASQAMLLAELPSRKHAGEMEMTIAKNIADKTDWRKMLRGETIPDKTLTEIRSQVESTLPEEYREYLLLDSHIHTFHYPRTEDAVLNLNSLSLDKVPNIKGRLLGVKGQYLLLDNGVFNVKKHSGYSVAVDVS